MQKIIVQDQELYLHRHKAIYWKREKMLAIADFHIGKSGFFRRNGIPVHSGIDKINIKNLFAILKYYKPEHLVFLGDLFHNKVNGEWKDLKALLDNFKSLTVHLVIGNHDILPSKFYDQIDFKVIPEQLDWKPFIFSHKPLDKINTGSYNLSGHIHPAIVLKGRGKQFEKLSCFYFNETHGIMPAFGEFTGLTVIRPRKNDRIYVVTDTGVFPV